MITVVTGPCFSIVIAMAVSSRGQLTVE
jgi:hypothetical protein